MDKRHFAEVFREFNFRRTITIHKGKKYYVGCIDTYRVTGFCSDLDECLNRCREMVTDMPAWLVKCIGA